MGKLNYGKAKKFKRGCTSIKVEGNRIDAAERWLKKNEPRIMQERERDRQGRLADASISWERFEAF